MLNGLFSEVVDGPELGVCTNHRSETFQSIMVLGPGWKQVVTSRHYVGYPILSTVSSDLVQSMFEVGEFRAPNSVERRTGYGSDDEIEFRVDLVPSFPISFKEILECAHRSRISVLIIRTIEEAIHRRRPTSFSSSFLGDWSSFIWSVEFRCSLTGREEGKRILFETSLGFIAKN